MSVQNEEAIITIKVKLESAVEGDPVAVKDNSDPFFGKFDDDGLIPLNAEEMKEAEAQAQIIFEEFGIDARNDPEFGFKRRDKFPGEYQGERDVPKPTWEIDSTSKSPLGYSLEDEFDEEDIEDTIIENLIDNDVQNLVQDIVKEKEVPTADKDGIQKATEFINEIEGQGIRNLTQFATSPQGFMEHGLIRALGRAGPHGAIIAAIITAIAASPKMVEVIVKALGVKGGPLNQDYRFSEDAQINLIFSRLVQFRKLTGDEQIITAADKGFAVGDPDFVNNNLVYADIARTARVGLRTNSLGYIHGI